MTAINQTNDKAKELARKARLCRQVLLSDELEDFTEVSRASEYVFKSAVLLNNEAIQSEILPGRLFSESVSGHQAFYIVVEHIGAILVFEHMPWEEAVMSPLLERLRLRLPVSQARKWLAPFGIHIAREDPMTEDEFYAWEKQISTCKK